MSAHKPHVVLLDIAMPGMDGGLQALPQIKHESPGTIVIMLTGVAETAGALSAVEHGAHGYIRKGGAIKDFLTQPHGTSRYMGGVHGYSLGRHTDHRLCRLRRLATAVCGACTGPNAARLRRSFRGPNEITARWIEEHPVTGARNRLLK